MNAKTIGIVGCSAEGAALCYRTLCAEAPQRMGPHSHPEIVMHTPSLSLYVEALESNDLDKVAELMLTSAEILANAGAELLICPDNTIHQAMDKVRPNSPVPWLHIAEVLAQFAHGKGFRRVGLTGTRWLVDSEVYPKALAGLGIDFERPSESQRQEINRIIMDELVYGQFKPGSIQYFQDVVDHFKAKGCDAVVLGCTEIPLILGDHNASLPTLDSTRLLARAALNYAIDGE